MNDKIYRQQHIVEKARRNDEVVSLFNQHFNEFPHSDLELLADTLMKMTYVYEGGDFVDHFMRVYKELRKSYGISNMFYKPVALEFDVALEDEEQDNYSLLTDKRLKQHITRGLSKEITKGQTHKK